MDTSRYAELFLTESRDNLSAINHALLELERAPDSPEHVAELFRAVHTVKGMSATMGYAAVAELCHDLETTLDVVRRGEERVEAALVDVLFHAADALEHAIEMCATGRAEEVDVGVARGELRHFAERAADADGPPTPAPDGTPRLEDAPAPDGEGLVVRVRQGDDTMLRGARAFLAVQRAATVGEVRGTSPSLDDLQAERFGRDFVIRLATEADDEAIERAIRSAGNVERVLVQRGAVVGGGSASVGEVSEARAARQHRHVRIDLQRLDTLMNLIGELVITRGRLVELTARRADPALEEAVAQASRLISDLQDGIMASRMVPVWQVFDRFPRLVRDAARALGRQVDFVIEGKEIELDRSMLDELGDPVVHLLRNAIDHGIESPEARAAAGKPAAGRLVLSAARERESVVIRVTDDGKGIDRDRVLARARARGQVDAATTALGDEELIRLISQPGFSTAEQVTDISGRGVGVDAVATRVRALGGTLDIRSAPGEGTAVTLRLPATLAIVHALLARVAGETYALPMAHVSETVRVETGTLRTVRGRDVMVLRGDVLPVLRLRELVGLPRRDEAGGRIVVVEMSDRRAGVIVDELTGQQEIVVKSFDAVRGSLACFSGATILGDGAPALILDVGTLL